MSFYDLIEAIEKNDIDSVRELLAASPRDLEIIGDSNTAVSSTVASQTDSMSLNLHALAVSSSDETMSAGAGKDSDETSLKSARDVIVPPLPSTSQPHRRQRSASLACRRHFVDESTPLHFAAEHGRLEIAEMLLEEHGAAANVDAQNEQGITALAIAAERGRVPFVRLLLRYGASANSKDRGGRTALHAAARCDMTQVARDLLDAMTKDAIDARDEDGDTALHIASRRGNRELVRMLLMMGASVDIKNAVDNSSLLEALVNGQQEVARVLLRSGASVTERGEQGLTPLHALLMMVGEEQDVLDIARIMLNAGARTDARAESGDTPLHLAGTASIARFLLQSGASVDAYNEKGHTPLRDALEDGLEDVARVLLEHGANPEIADREGKKPIDLMNPYLIEYYHAYSEKPAPASPAESVRPALPALERTTSYEHIPVSRSTTASADSRYLMLILDALYYIQDRINVSDQLRDESTYKHEDQLEYIRMQMHQYDLRTGTMLEDLRRELDKQYRLHTDFVNKASRREQELMRLLVDKEGEIKILLTQQYYQYQQVLQMPAPVAFTTEFESQLDELKVENAKLREQIVLLTQKVADRDSTVQRLETECARAVRDAEDAKTRTKYLEAEIAAAKPLTSPSQQEIPLDQWKEEPRTRIWRSYTVASAPASPSKRNSASSPGSPATSIPTSSTVSSSTPLVASLTKRLSMTDPKSLVSALLKTPLQQWSVQQVQDWLLALDSAEFRSVLSRFQEKNVDGKSLAQITERELKEMGISIGHRKRLLSARDELSNR